MSSRRPTPTADNWSRPARPLERQLAIWMAALVTLGTALLGMGQQDFRLPLLVAVVAIASVYFTDIRKWFRLNRLVANLAALAAMGISLVDLQRLGPNQQLLAIANLLVYLQVVLLFQEKNVRIYWQLIMLSLLQVVVAAALNYSFLFGMLLTIYLFLGLATLTRFYVYRETLRFPERHDAPTPERRTSRAAVQWQGPAAHATGRSGAAWGIGRTTLRMGLATLALTVGLFFGLPRFGSSPWRASATQTQRVVGFSQRVTLGDLGEVIQNPEIVMRVQFIDEQTGRPIELTGEPLLRGSVVMTYAHNQWSQGSRMYRNEVKRLPQPGTRHNLVRQKIMLEPLNTRVVFCVFPAFRLDDETPVAFDADRQQIIRPDRLTRSQFACDLGTLGIRNGRQYPITPAARTRAHDIRRLLELPRRPDGSDPLKQLKALAGEVVEESRVDSSDRYLVALALDAWLRHKGGFTYSLSAQQRDPDLDPIEDFVAKNRTGHCEYFASALTLMLRSQGIPARMVIGYKGGEWNSLGSFYQFRQLHAHTWVEAYLRPEDLADRKIDVPGFGFAGGWLRLDPTAEAVAGLSTTTGLLARVGEMVDYVQMLWTTNVVGLNYQRQQRNIYKPLAQVASDAADGISGPRGWAARLVRRAQNLVDALWAWLAGNWFSWRGGLVAMTGSLLLVGLWRLARWAWRRIARLVAGQRSGGAAASQVAFYRRLERLLAGQGLERPASQTQREFATVAGGQLAESQPLREVAPLPRQIVDAFYRVRFGHRGLDSDEALAVEHALDRLEQELAGKRNRPGG